ncbi:hypothetical protein CYMTET_2960 [Cymbomonas tetramitiformis]|uniref:Uncharacterized protein n=1 Tax=Cymbomonas tetramitiformis TaxID=36881 RepID=A0AAE0H4N3_9CHLO|nr:hypothetical protein CYMTET_2960 [Cymbomonas tetramitiformis]
MSFLGFFHVHKAGVRKQKAEYCFQKVAKRNLATVYSAKEGVVRKAASSRRKTGEVSTNSALSKAHIRVKNSKSRVDVFPSKKATVPKNPETPQKDGTIRNSEKAKGASPSTSSPEASGTGKAASTKGFTARSSAPKSTRKVRKPRRAVKAKRPIKNSSAGSSSSSKIQAVTRTSAGSRSSSKIQAVTRTSAEETVPEGKPLKSEEPVRSGEEPGPTEADSSIGEVGVITTYDAQKWQTTRDWKLMLVNAHESISDKQFNEIQEDLGLLNRWRPMVSFLVVGLGLTKAQLEKVLDRREGVLSMGVERARGRCAFLAELGLSKAEIAKVIVSHPRVLEYRTKRTMQPRVSYLLSIGVQQEDLPKVVLRAPMLLSQSIERTLMPRVRFLNEKVGLPEESLGRLIARHPTILTLGMKEVMEPRLRFFRSIGVSKEGIGKMVAKHPQILQYSIESMRPRLEYLQSIGMGEEEIILCVGRLVQLFSLSVENTLKPKYDYLQRELGGSVDTVTSYPAYFSLSLNRRIKPRHRILVNLNHQEYSSHKPFPMKYFALSDADFAKKVARCSLSDFESFREKCILSDQVQSESGNTVQQPQRRTRRVVSR